tara:strand:+ start:116 stop:397 length:282 start_codon:yes stop_codon:yes gene_type:complete
MSDALMYGAIIAVAAVALVLIGLVVGYHHATLAEQIKHDTSPKKAPDEVFAHEIEIVTKPQNIKEHPDSTTLIKRTNAPVVVATPRSQPLLRL